MNNAVYALTVYDSKLIAGGSFTKAGGEASSYLAQWNKGECDCSVWGDLDDDGTINPVDVVIMINHVYLLNDTREPLPNCPREAGDVNCNGDVNPVDVVFYINHVYLLNDMFCADPCL